MTTNCNTTDVLVVVGGKNNMRPCSSISQYFPIIRCIPKASFDKPYEFLVSIIQLRNWNAIAATELYTRAVLLGLISIKHLVFNVVIFKRKKLNLNLLEHWHESQLVIVISPRARHGHRGIWSHGQDTGDGHDIIMTDDTDDNWLLKNYLERMRKHCQKTERNNNYTCTQCLVHASLDSMQPHKVSCDSNRHS